MEAQEFMADPTRLVAEAAKEPSRRGLQDYSAAILLLKEEKGFSFREIAAWLGERGVRVDHNAVWRAYSKVAKPSRSQAPVEHIERFERTGGKDEALTWM